VTTSGGAGDSGGGGAGGIDRSGGAGGSFNLCFPTRCYHDNGGGGAGWLGAGGDGLGSSSGGGGSTYPSFAGGGGSVGSGAGGFGGGGGGGLYAGGGGGGYSGGGGAGPDGGGGGGGSDIAASFFNLVTSPGANGSSNYATPSNGEVTVGGMSFNYTGAIVDETIPITGLYDIVAAGAQGGGSIGYESTGGYGAEVGGDIELAAGTELGILVGGAGDGSGISGAGGGGGSFVWIVSEQSAVPEPSTWAMMLLGFISLGWTAWRKAKDARLFS